MVLICCGNQNVDIPVANNNIYPKTVVRCGGWYSSCDPLVRALLTDQYVYKIFQLICYNVRLHTLVEAYYNVEELVDTGVDGCKVEVRMDLAATSWGESGSFDQANRKERGCVGQSSSRLALFLWLRFGV